MRIRTLTVLLATAVALVLPSTAVADQAVVRDAGQDVYEVLPGEDDEHVPVGTMVNTDLRRTVVDHRADHLVVSVRYDELAKRASSRIYLPGRHLDREGKPPRPHRDVRRRQAVLEDCHRDALRHFAGTSTARGARAEVKTDKTS